MKKHLILFICLTILVSGVAQPINKPARKEINFKTPVLQLKSNTQKSSDWWEPDTITLYQLSGLDSRYLFEYVNGKLSAEVIQYFEIGKWENFSKNNYSYNEQKNLKESTFQIWESNEWVENSKFSYSYNVLNNITEVLQQYWDMNQWKNSYKTKYSYNEQNQLSELLFLDWEEEWVNSSRTTFLYFEQNLKIENIHQSWESGEWVNYEKEISIYDIHDNLLEVLYQNWDDAQWESYWKESYSYNPQNNITELLYQYWESNDWENVYRLKYTYDMQNNLTERKVQDWWDEWIDNQINSYTYDDYNNRTSETVQFWDWDLSEWEYDEKSNYEYDKNNNAFSGFGQQWKDGTWVDGSAEINIYYNHMQSLFEDKDAYKFTASYIKPAENSVPENRIENGIKVYPNPTKGQLIIDNGQLTINNVEIFDIMGKKISSHHLITSLSNQKIDISHLPVGIYFLHAAGQTVKVVKQ